MPSKLMIDEKMDFLYIRIAVQKYFIRWFLD